jgi:hypothetical protein
VATFPVFRLGQNDDVRKAALLTACLAAAAAISGGPAPAEGAACPYQAQVFVYGQNGWTTLTNALAAYQTPCANYYVVLTALESDKTRPRGRTAVDFIHSKGPNFHALAEFNWTGWSRARRPATWYGKGVSFRQKMAAAGYDPARDTWVINELSSALRTKPVARSKAREAMRGLFTGPRGAPQQQGAVFIVGTGQNRRNFPPYKAQQQGWLVDSAWWTAVSPYVAWWGQEAYPSCKFVCVPRSKIADRSRAINEFVQHPARLAFAPNAPPQTGAAKALFDRAYLPLMTAYWRDLKGYGGNRITLAQMQAFASLEVYAARAWAIRNPYPDGRLGFAWNEHVPGASAAQVQALATRLAQSIQGAYGDGGTAGKACGPTGAYTGCREAVAGARFNPGWATFATW